MSLIPSSISGNLGGVQIEHSLLVSGVDGIKRKFDYNMDNNFALSLFIKKSSTAGAIFRVDNNNWFGFNSSQQLTLVTSSTTRFTSTRFYKDTQAFYYIFLRVYIHTNGDRRWSLEVNGENALSSDFVVVPNSTFNTAVVHTIGGLGGGSNLEARIAYLAFFDITTETAMLQSSQYVYVDPITGVLTPKIPKYFTQTHFGPNGFFIKADDYLPPANSKAKILALQDYTRGIHADTRLSSVSTPSAVTNFGTRGTNWYDGTKVQAMASCSLATTPTAGYTPHIGYTWGSSTSKIINAFRLVAPSDAGFSGNSSPVQFKLQGSDDGTTWVDLTSPISSTGASGETIVVTTGINTTTAYQRHRIIFNANGTSSYYVAEAEFYEPGKYGLNSMDFSTGASWSPTGSYNGQNQTRDVPLTYGTSRKGCTATLNPLRLHSNTVTPIFASSNCYVQGTGTANTGAGVISNLFFSTGKFYIESTIWAIETNGSRSLRFGITRLDTSTSIFSSVNCYIDITPTNYYIIVNDNTVSSAASTFAMNDTIGMAVDLDVAGAYGSVTFYKNGTALYTNSLVQKNTIYTVLAYVTTNASSLPSGLVVNFGQWRFKYTVPQGYSEGLHTGMLPPTRVPNPRKEFKGALWTGSGSTQTVYNDSNFRVGLEFIKGRSLISNPTLNYNPAAYAGYNYETHTNVTPPSNMDDISRANNWSLDLISANSNYNQNAATYYAALWKLNGTYNPGTEGMWYCDLENLTTATTTSEVNANTLAGISVCTFVIPTTGEKRIAHGLRATPDLIFLRRHDAATGTIYVYHKDFRFTTGSGGVGSNASVAVLNTNAAAVNTVDQLWGTSAQNSTDFGLNASMSSYIATGAGVEYIAVCVASVPGFSSVGTYFANNSTDGMFIPLDFSARAIMIKCGSTGNWVWFDKDRTTGGINKEVIAWNSTAAEVVDSLAVEFMSNGVKLRTADASVNSSGYYYYWAIADASTKYALAAIN